MPIVFSEAEQGMETLSRVQGELGGCCTSETVREKGEELRKRLDTIVTDVLERYDFADINNFCINSPKELLSQLAKVASHGGAKFTQAYTSMFRKTQQTFDSAIDEVRKAPFNERSGKIHSLSYALHYLPDDLHKRFEKRIDDLSKWIAEEEKRDREALNVLVTNVEEDEHHIVKIGLLAEEYKRENMHDRLKTLREQCVKKLHMYRADTQKSLDDQNIRSAIDNVRKILIYEEHVGAYLSEIKGISENIRAIIKNSFLNCCGTLGSISTIEQTPIVEKAFNDILIYLEFSNTLDKKLEEFFPNDVMQNAEEALQQMSDYLIDNSEKFRVALKDMNILELHKPMCISKKWQKLLDQISHCSLNRNLVQNLLKEIRRVTPYRNMLTELDLIIEHFKNQLNVEFITEETILFEVKREKLIRDVIDGFNALKTINTKFRDILLSPVDIDAFEKEIKEKLEKIRNQLMMKASKSELSDEDADDFRTYYNHLQTFNKYVRLPGVNIQQALDESQAKIYTKVHELKSTN